MFKNSIVLSILSSMIYLTTACATPPIASTPSEPLKNTNQTQPVLKATIPEQKIDNSVSLIPTNLRLPQPFELRLPQPFEIASVGELNVPAIPCGGKSGNPQVVNVAVDGVEYDASAVQIKFSKQNQQGFFVMHEAPWAGTTTSTFKKKKNLHKSSVFKQKVKAMRKKVVQKIKASNLKPTTKKLAKKGALKQSVNGMSLSRRKLANLKGSARTLAKNGIFRDRHYYVAIKCIAGSDQGKTFFSKFTIPAKAYQTYYEQQDDATKKGKRKLLPMISEKISTQDTNLFKEVSEDIEKIFLELYEAEEMEEILSEEYGPELGGLDLDLDKDDVDNLEAEYDSLAADLGIDEYEEEDDEEDFSALYSEAEEEEMDSESLLKDADLDVVSDEDIYDDSLEEEDEIGNIDLSEYYSFDDDDDTSESGDVPQEDEETSESEADHQDEE